MNTPEAILRLPKANPSHELCFFLHSTGPTAPHRRPSTLSASKSSAKNGFRFRKLRQEARVTAAKIREAVGQAPDFVPSSVEEKSSSSGKKYFALKGDPTLDNPPGESSTLVHPEAQIDVPMISPSIVESRVSISFAESINSAERLEHWRPSSPEEHRARSSSLPKADDYLALDYERLLEDTLDDVEPIRPRASNPPTPEPISAVSMADSYRSDLTDNPAKHSFDISRALTSHPVYAGTSSSLPLLTSIHPAHRTGQDRPVEIEHPCPRRYASHNVLLQRTSSLGSPLDRRSITDSPGPPPRSPLRPRSDARIIDGILESYHHRESTPKLAPSIMDPKDFHTEVPTITPTVITECTGPIKRPKSRGLSISSPYQSLRRQREERLRARKLRDRQSASTPMSIIDAIIRAPPPLPRQRLRKTRPRLQIPSSLKSAPVARRTSSSASSNTSSRNVSASTAGRTAVPTLPSPDTPVSPVEKTGHTPISPPTSNGSTATETPMSLSPVMLVAEEVPLPKSKPSKPAKMIMKEGKSYSARPRSASIPRSAMKRRSRQGAQTRSRPNSPVPPPVDDDPPPLPSPPPNRALPPTPPASGSEKTNKVRSARLAGTRALPMLPSDEAVAQSEVQPRRRGQMPHVATLQKGVASKVAVREPMNISTILNRLEELEQSNAMLNAALTTILKANGTPPGGLSDTSTGLVPIPQPMSWESRVTRRSTADHVASTSYGSGGEMSVSTKYESSRGC